MCWGSGVSFHNQCLGKFVRSPSVEPIPFSHSWTYDRSNIRLASWHKSVFVALVVVSNLDAAAFKAATATIDARLN